MHENWVFGYGSLMWNPGFRFIERRRAVIHGYHRSLCMISHMYRGTPDRPGLVLGLDIGGACHGIAFNIADADWAEVVDYLRAREQVTNMYHELTKPVRIVGDEARKVPALFYAVTMCARGTASRAHASIMC
jgi:cation transport protein ChaC